MTIQSLTGVEAQMVASLIMHSQFAEDSAEMLGIIKDEHGYDYAYQIAEALDNLVTVANQQLDPSEQLDVKYVAILDDICDTDGDLLDK